jgi:hypothetical protein
MPVTSFVDFTAAVRGIGSRTNAAGAAVTDYSAEEDRLVNTIVTEGAITPNAFKVNASAGMVVTVGSGAAKTDLYAVAGDVAGQGVYLARLEAATVNVTVPAADAAAARTDEVYLFIADAPYDAGTLGLPRIGYRKGDAGGGAPGPDAAWKASVKLATIAVGAAVSSITAGNITDNRVASTLTLVGAPDTRYLGAGAKAADADKLDGVDSSGFARELPAATIPTAETLGSTSGAYTDLTTPGPQVTFTMPPAGTVDVTVGCRMNPGSSAEQAKMSFQINATPAADANALIVSLPASSGDTALSRTSQLVGTPGATYVLTAKYAALGSGSVDFADRNITVN